ncbi:MAG: DUF87 domain-containing protein [Bacteroidota bacterium]
MKHELEIGTLMSGAKFTLPLDLVTRTLAIIAIRGAGKTIAATVIAEEFCECGMPWVALDPVGVWWGLRCNPEGGPGGYPVVVLGGEHADIPIEKHIGARVADAILQENVSCVVDLSGESKNTWRQFVADFCDRLMELRPAVPRHIFIEEAPEFVPQKPMGEQKRSLAAVDRLIRLGRNRGYGATLISQRFATIQKDVLTQCESLLALRSIGKPDRSAVRNWIAECITGAHAERDAAKFLDSLVGLPDGQGWFWSPQWLKIFSQIRIRRRKTYHPGATRTVGEAPKQVQLSDVKEFVDRFGSALAKESEKREARKTSTVSMDSARVVPVDPMTEENARLRAQVADLHRQLGEAKAALQAIRKVMEPEYRAMQKLFSEIDSAAAAVGIDAGRYEIWRARLNSGEWQLLQFFVEKRTLTKQQMQILMGRNRETVRLYCGKLVRAGLVAKEGDHWILQELQ